MGPMKLVHDRHSGERIDLDLRGLLSDPSTRVLPLVGERAPVQENENGGMPTLSTRAPREGDVTGEVVVFLGRDEAGRALIVVAEPAEDPAGVASPADTITDDLDAQGDTADTAEITEISWQGLRDIGPWLPPGDAEAFMAAQGMAAWHRSHRFCPRCGAATEPAAAGWVRRCPVEGRELYPRTDPAVIMGIRDADDRLLLGRGPQWPEGRRSVLAGFVEPGESLEDAVRREVAEEVGIVVDRVEYVDSQPWPFPASLMLGFAGWSTTTDIVCDPAEMAEAEWFTREEVARAVREGELLLPGRLSIARRLIEGWFGERMFVPQIDERGGQPWIRPS